VNVTVEKVALEAIMDLREHFLKITNTLIRYNACHERGGCDSYLTAPRECRPGMAP
jgi:hypothetical protein